MISGATLPHRAIALIVGEGSKSLLETFPEVGLSFRTLVPGSLGTAKGSGRCMYYIRAVVCRHPCSYFSPPAL